MDDFQLFEQMASCLDGGQNVALATVVDAIGSTPGKVGYKMLVGADGRLAGTVGGGLVEAKVIEEARQVLAEPASRLLRFDLAGTPDDEKGICGGSVEIIIETFDRASAPLFRGLADATDGGALVSILSTDRMPRKRHLHNVEALGSELPPEVVIAIQGALASGDGAAKVSADEMVVFVERLAVRPHAILFGAGHLAQHIAQFARSVGFRVTVCDDRQEYANHERFPQADAILVEDIPRAFDGMRIDKSTYLVIVTRGHRHDEAVLERAVRTGARYIGMIGSRRKVLTLFDRLRDKGIAAEQLEKVYAPVGLDIGAVTPEEIALSIVCEIVKVRRRGDGSQIGHMSLSGGRGDS